MNINIPKTEIRTANSDMTCDNCKGRIREGSKYELGIITCRGKRVFVRNGVCCSFAARVSRIAMPDEAMPDEGGE